MSGTTQGKGEMRCRAKNVTPLFMNLKLTALLELTPENFSRRKTWWGRAREGDLKKGLRKEKPLSARKKREQTHVHPERGVTKESLLEEKEEGSMSQKNVAQKEVQKPNLKSWKKKCWAT